MASITLKVPDNKVDDIVNALKAYGAVEVESDDEVSIHSLDELMSKVYPGLNPDQIRGEHLKTARKDANLTQKALAELIGAEQSHIADMEKGKRSIGKVRAKKLAAVLKVDYRVFL